jgi:hypothetical protein
MNSKKKNVIALMSYPTPLQKISGLRLGDEGKQQLEYAWKKFEFPEEGFDYIFIDNSIFSQLIIAQISSLTVKRKEPVKIITTKTMGITNKEHREEFDMLTAQTLDEFENWKKENPDSRAETLFDMYIKDLLIPHIHMQIPGMTVARKNILIFHGNLFLQKIGMEILGNTTEIKHKNLPTDYEEILKGISLKSGDGILFTIDPENVTVSVRKQLVTA